jgi:1-acyl-sn-glycerol-3-phosphate acyltransferase
MPSHFTERSGPMTGVSNFRLMIVPFLAAIFSRSLAENTVRVFLFGILSRGTLDENNRLTLILIWVGVMSIGSLLITPLAATIAMSNIRRGLLGALAIVGAVICGASSFVATPMQDWWVVLICWFTFEGMIFSVSRQQLFVDFARKAEVPLSQMTGIGLTAALSGAMLGIWLGLESDPTVKRPGMPDPLRYAVIAYAIAFLSWIFIRVPRTVVSSTENPLKIFLSTPKAMFQRYYVRETTITLILWSIGLTCLIANFDFMMRPEIVIKLGLALTVGSVISGMHGHLFRVGGWMPYSWTLILILQLYAWIAGDWESVLVPTSFAFGLILPPAMSYVSAQIDDRSRASTFSWLFSLMGLSVFFTLIALKLSGTSGNNWGMLTTALVTITALLATLHGWLRMFRCIFEFTVEVCITILYPIKGGGSGLYQLPWRGPCLVIANHACWVDPLWIAKILPFQTTPMMTARFYDLPVIAWLMRKVIGTIRVPESGFRREAPEIQEAIAALDRGECVVLFPEGWLRRKEEIPIRRFCRGVWDILKERPNTPIYPCWIEGGWGSYTSYWNGPPTKNKKMDFLHRVKIGVRPVVHLSEETLANHMKTRFALMEEVNQARAEIGLPLANLGNAPGEDDNESEKGES